MAEGGRRAAAVEAASQPHVWIPWRCLCLGLVRHTTNSTPPRRRTNLHASHISRNADRTCPHAPPPRVSVRPLSRMIAAACGLKGRQGAPCDTGGVSGTCTRVQCTVETVCRAVVLPSSLRTSRHADDTGSSPWCSCSVLGHIRAVASSFDRFGVAIHPRGDMDDVELLTLDDFHLRAASRLPRMVYDYYAGGAETEW